MGGGGAPEVRLPPAAPTVPATPPRKCFCHHPSRAPQPVHLAQLNPAGAQRLARADHDAALRGVEAHDVERMSGGNSEPAPLADGEMDDAGMGAEHAAGFVHDVARLGGAGSQALDNVAIAAGGDEADVLAVLLLRDRKTEAARKLARLCLGHVAQRKAQELELLPGGGKQEVALVAGAVAGAIKRPARTGQAAARNIMSGGQRLG